MSLKKNINYDCKSDLVEGFQDHSTQGRSGLIASFALVFMIGGIRKKVKQPIAHYFSSGFATADRLAVLIKEVLHQCYKAGVNIAATVCDMDGVNRRALSILGASTEHPYIIVENREIVVMFDTPHLLKCFRNMFLKYNIECDTNINSNLQTGRGVAKWEHIIQFYEIDNKNPNFVFAPCLRKDHLDPNNKQKMKVNLAAQVLSHSVAAGMFSKISDGSLTAAATTTANVIANMDKLFDCLNSESSDLRRGKRHATNLTAINPHLIFFQDMKRFFVTLKFIGSSRKPPSQEGWIWTINAVERLWRNLVQKHHIKSLATRRLQQDALENLFGCIRGNCDSNTNPTCGQFVAGLKTAVLSNLAHMGTSGNCETDNNVIINNFDTFLSVSQPKQQTNNDSVASASLTTTSALYSEVDEAINTNDPEIQACAYVAGFIIKKLPVNNCEVCRKIFVSDTIDINHLFVSNREYETDSQSLNYAHKDFISCVELCASAINIFLKDNAYVKMIKKRIFEDIKTIVNFDFIKPCIAHKDENIEIIINCVFFICMKRFCILKNRSFAEEASASSLKRKVKIILHK
ncbi:unnamed protein product [Euphydryas editha]|uniref:Transposable element P transposase n=1 Tax=Euphydryas editha TaxID=104508 RepID=A0AAU9V332_EUPED|nr:unnamed protein product [Euphydryas editha]